VNQGTGPHVFGHQLPGQGIEIAPVGSAFSWPLPGLDPKVACGHP